MPERWNQCGADDEELADRFLAGDRAAFDALVLRRPSGWLADEIIPTSAGVDEAFLRFARVAA